MKYLALYHTLVFSKAKKEGEAKTQKAQKGEV